MATPRPRSSVRGGRVHSYNKPEYTQYKQNLINHIQQLQIPSEDYRSLVAVFYVPYPKSTPKKKLIDHAPCIKKPDSDNYLKGLMDSIEQAGVLSDDGRIAYVAAGKRYTTNSTGFIQFSLG